MITSEGFAARLIDPWVREFGLDGRQLSVLPVPDAFSPNAAGTRAASARTSASRARDAAERPLLFTGTEAALVQDGPPATVGAGSPARILRYNLQRASSTASTLLDGSDRRAARAGDTVRGQRPRRAAAAEQPVPARDGALVLGRRAGHRQYDQALRGRAPRCGRRQRLRQPRDAARVDPARGEDAAPEPRRARDSARQRRGDDLRPEAAGRPPLARPRQRQQLPRPPPSRSSRSSQCPRHRPRTS